MSRVENALMRLYEDADLRDELTDDEADQMFKWAEGELTRLDESGVDDATFESQVDTLLSMLKKINRFAGRQGQFSAQANDQASGNIAALATELGHPATAEQVAAAGTGDPSSTLAALISLMNAASTVSASEPSASPETPQADSAPDQSASPADASPAPDQLASPSDATPSLEPEPASDQPTSSPDQPSTDFPDIPFGAYIDEYDL